MKMQPSVIVKKLFMQGMMVTVNHEIDFEKAQEIALEYDIIAEPVSYTHLHLIYEIVDNAVDEHLAGYCSLIHVILEKDGSCTVTDKDVYKRQKWSN